MAQFWSIYLSLCSLDWGGKLPDNQPRLRAEPIDCGAVLVVLVVLVVVMFLFSITQSPLVSAVWCHSNGFIMTPAVGPWARVMPGNYVNASHYTIIHFNVCNSPLSGWTIQTIILPLIHLQSWEIFISPHIFGNLISTLLWKLYRLRGGEIWNICYQLKIVHIKQIRSFALSLPVN